MSSSRKNMLVGGAICLIGAVVTLVTYQAAKGGGSYVVAYGAIGVGAVQFLYGLFQFIGQQEQPATGSGAPMLALHAMAYVASGDGAITEKEIGTMNLILQRIAGAALPDEVKGELGKLGRLAPDQAASFQRARLSRDEKEMVLQCAAMVSLSDGEIAGAGPERIARVGLALGLSHQDQQVVLHRITKILAGSDTAPTAASG